MMRSILFAVALFAGTAANAATYDAFKSFDGIGSSTDGAFTFGEYDGATFTAFDTVGVSTFPGTLSYSMSGAYYPVVVKTATGGSYPSNTVTIPNDALVLSPGPGSAASGGPFAAIRFVAPVAGIYNIAANAVQIDTSINTVEAGFVFRGSRSSFGLVSGVPTYLNNYVPASLNATRAFAKGEELTLLIGNAGSYYSDTTAVKFTVTDTVPEPAAWSLLLGGFALTGAAMRRRSSVLVVAA
jgi:hypothetical protein